MDISATLCMSPCSPDCIISNFGLESGVQSLRIPVGWEAQPRGLKPGDFAAFAARLKPCPSTNFVPFEPHEIRFLLTFPADYLHPPHCHANLPPRSVGYSDLPANSQILLRLANR